jgi:hypothetical protein
LNISGVTEVISAFLWSESLDDAANSTQQAVNGALGRLAQMRFHFGERHFDGIEVGRVVQQIISVAPAASIASLTPATL